MNKKKIKKTIEIKEDKIKILKKIGVSPFFGKFKKTYYSEEIKKKFSLLEGKEVIISGRMIKKRIHGKAIFFDILDLEGVIQVYIRENIVGTEKFELFCSLIDIGDIVGVKGLVFKTQKKEISIKTKSFVLLTKSLSLLPEKFHGLKNIDLRYRYRYLDLIVNKNVKKNFLLRTKIIKKIRNILDEKKFLEVETPILTSKPGGAAARPFSTYHNSLSLKLFLRISLEIPLKKLLIGGFEKIYEIGKVFRNEGISVFHNPEFTLLELYKAYGDITDMMFLTKKIIIEIAKHLNDNNLNISYQDVTIDLKNPWEKISMTEVVRKYTKIDFDKIKTNKEAINICAEKIGFDKIKNKSKGEILNEMFEAFVEKNLIQPTFVYDYPIEISPLAKRSINDFSKADRFEFFIFGREIANAFSELNDPIEQNKRFLKQQINIKKETQEEFFYDIEFIEALKYGMPPAGGLGIGIDRLVMLFSNVSSIRDVILFPTMKKKD